MMSEAPLTESYGSTNNDGHLSESHCSEDLLRRKLKYFFLNPCEKWRAKKKFPWKLLLQIIKLVLVTIQLAMFGTSRSAHVEFLEKSNIAFKHLFLENWTASMETLPYPPSSGAFAIYTHDEFYSSVNYAMKKYSETEDAAVGSYQFARYNDSSPVPPMVMCNSHYKLGKNWSRNQSYQFDARQETTCFPVHHIWEYDNKTGELIKAFDIKTYLKENNHSVNFDGVNTVVLKFDLTAIHLKYLSRLNSPDCYIFHIQIEYDNREHNGQILVSLLSSELSLPCFGEVHFEGGNSSAIIFASVFDAVVIVVSIMSFILCTRSLGNGHRLKMKTVQFFCVHLHKELTIYDRLEFLNMWYVLININDLLTVLGSAYKIGIENKISHNYEACGILLGTGSLLVWFGVLRYLGFFQKYNILILTMKKSAPNILRFLVCAGVFYFGFTVCGWVVLGPYHIKFRKLHSASECLFSLVNGDDMFVTFAAIKDNNYVWWYSRIYLYTFISLFIYVILSVFISVIMDTYETIKNYNINGFPLSTLESFIEECTDDAHTLFRSYSSDKLRRMSRPSCPLCICSCLPLPCCQSREDSDGERSGEYTSLIS